MRLTLTLPELEAGRAIQHGPTDRIVELEAAAANHTPVAVSPVETHDHEICCVVIPTEAFKLSDTKIELTFKPVVLKTFLLCAKQKDRLLAMICELGADQFWVDFAGFRRCNLTTHGNGTDPKVVQNSYYVMGDFLAAPERPDILRYAMDLMIERIIGEAATLSTTPQIPTPAKTESVPAS